MLFEKAFYNTKTNCILGQANTIYMISHLITLSRSKVFEGGEWLWDTLYLFKSP